MDLSKTSVVIRPRSAWEAVDLGTRMANHWFLVIFVSWLIITLPVFALLQALLPWREWLPVLVFWWLKPWWERIPLYVLSRGLFGVSPSISETVKAWPGQLKISPMAFLLYRINAQRSLLMPVRILEQLKGKNRVKRERQLCAEDVSPSSWLTILGVHVETFLFISCYSIFVLLFPEQFSGNPVEYLDYLKADASFFNNNWLYYLISGLVMPYYVASGFTLYLNRRIRLEGWDIEIAFRQLAEKKRTTPLASHVICITFAALLATSSLLTSKPATAAEASVNSPAEARTLIEEVLTEEEFHEIRIVKSPELKEDSKLPEFLKEWLESRRNTENKSSGGLPVFAFLLETLFWAALIGVIILIIWQYRDRLGSFMGKQRSKSAANRRPESDVLPENIPAGPAVLPADITARCRELWHEQNVHQALSLLYSASVRLFNTDRADQVPESATERECLRIIQGELGHDKASYFSELNRVWIFLAYGQIQPSEESFAKLCDDWQLRWHSVLEQNSETSDQP